MKDLFFVAVIPPDPIFKEISTFKEELKEEFGIKASLKSPPHITLHMPFRAKREKIQTIEQDLKVILGIQEPFSIDLIGFSSFEPKVIFVDVKANEKLEGIQKSIKAGLKRNNILNANYKDLPFKPHITLAFRDLKKPMFPKVWDRFEHREYHRGFICESVALLKHDGHRWNIFSEFDFKSSPKRSNPRVDLSLT